jgi:hypothetical protein
VDKRLVIGGIGALVVAILLLGLLIAQDTGPDLGDVPPAPEVQVEPRPDPGPVASKAVRHALKPPADIEPPEPPDERPAEAAVTPDDRRAMNYAVDHVLRAARDECIVPWLDTIPEPTNAEFVFDAVLYDGQLYDVGLRSLSLDMPGEVVDCVADRAWYADWPTWDLGGELRLQRQVEYRNAAATPP